jgi:nucleoside-diphosphate-sugar epimerase
VNNGRITVFGGEQQRPNIHIEDITDLYVQLLNQSNDKIAGKIWNAGYQNQKVIEIAEIVRDVVDKNGVEIITSPSDDNRSYHISSEKIRRELGFRPLRSIKDAISDLKKAFDAGAIPNALDDIRYYNIKTMQAIDMR